MPRLYGRKWGKARRLHLANNPLCVMCKAKGKIVAAEVVDHIIPHREDKQLFWDPNNWQSLCKFHHDSTKQSEEKSVNKGCNIDGIPNNINHHWK